TSRSWRAPTWNTPVFSCSAMPRPPLLAAVHGSDADVEGRGPPGQVIVAHLGKPCTDHHPRKRPLVRPHPDGGRRGVGCRAVGAFRRATLSISSLKSIPTTRPRGPAYPARRSARSPVPQQTSTARPPGGTWTRRAVACFHRRWRPPLSTALMRSYRGAIAPNIRRTYLAFSSSEAWPRPTRSPGGRGGRHASRATEVGFARPKNLSCDLAGVRQKGGATMSTRERLGATAILAKYQ